MKKFIVALMVIFMSACTLGGAVTPRQKVSEFLDKYKNENTDIISQLDETIDTEVTDEDHKSRYKTLMVNQYKNMEYEIKDEIIEEDNAVVEVEVTVYDYASAVKNANTYLNENIDEFKREVKETANDVKESVENAAEEVEEGIEDATGNDDEDNDDNNDDNDNNNTDNNNTDTNTTTDAGNAGNAGNADYDETKFMDYKLSLMEKVSDKVTYTIEFTLTKVNDEWQLDSLSNSDIEKLHGIYVQ